MTGKGVILYVCLVLAAMTLVRFGGKMESASARQAASLRFVASYGNLPLSFDANQGQTDSAVRYLSRGNGYSLFLTSTEAVLSLNSSRDLSSTALAKEDREGAVVVDSAIRTKTKTTAC